MNYRFFIDLHKGVTGLVMLLLMAIYGQLENPTAWAYLALHGGYGLLWVLKSRFFPDRSWEKPVSWSFGVFGIWGGLSTYWIGGWLVMAQGVHVPAWVLGLCLLVYTLGVFFHFSADMQKHEALKLQPGRLVTDGLWAMSRNPNYFGELLIYLGFGLLALHWLPVAILMLWVVAVWWPNMRRKDRSLSRYPDFTAYRARTKMFVPYVI